MHAKGLPANVDSVAAVVVTFQPDVTRLERLLEATLPQVQHVYVVDNGDGQRASSLLVNRQRTTLIAMGSNQGIGAAQNAGANAALTAGARHLLLLDQDSVPAEDMVRRLLDARRRLQAEGHQVAAVGPSSPSGSAPGVFVRVGWFHQYAASVAPDQPFVWCDLLIASGLLIPATAWTDVGGMDPSLFIDKVDTEWCMKAVSKGYRLAGVPAAVLHHRLGEQTRSVWLGRWKHVPVHQPFRYYYILRNSLLVGRRPWATWRWRTADARQCLYLWVMFGLFSKERIANLRYMVRGVVDGIKGRTGRLDNGRGT